MAEEAMIEELLIDRNTEIGRHLLDQLRLDSRYRQLAERATAKQNFLDAIGQVEPDIAGFSLSPPELRAWYFEQQRREPIPEDLDPAGYGFMEIGTAETDDGEISPFSLNFDVISHEIGHLLIFSLVGLPDLDRDDGEYYAFHESTADIISLISALHFDSVVDELLDQTSGNLYTYNHLTRFAELSTCEQIRLANNKMRMIDFAQGWHEEHDLSQPLTGAMFDILVDIFHEHLLDRGLVSEKAEDIADLLQRDEQAQDVIQAIFDEAYGQNSLGFKDALLDARDDAAIGLAAAWQSLSADNLTYRDVGEQLLRADRDLNDGRYQRLIASNLKWRQIGEISAGPRLAPPDDESHLFSSRTLAPDEHGLF